jgi:hypothetical protein
MRKIFHPRGRLRDDCGQPFDALVDDETDLDEVHDPLFDWECGWISAEWLRSFPVEGYCATGCRVSRRGQLILLYDA